MLEARGLSKSYGSVPAVRDISFSLMPGQVLGYLGPNGSGKSTTVKMLTGLLEPSQGQVLYGGQDIHADLAAYRKCLGYVPEEANLYPYLTGEEYLEMVAMLRAMPEVRKRRTIRALLASSARYLGLLFQRHAAANHPDRRADGQPRCADFG
jgi:ABC-2 type transport system ATP-binding protein